ncbi:bifunctional diaminohydroxyphosphoribosylaminopyrimidine deaminase/5-amino-6-(5-phosphoribosylamino)uracil reductase RibD [Aquiluna borgnonia]|nr:bifunctional diaminohydroxyphosphoribosylaminopyrimidine deaminase/5-amino-6-(5-phosphoribosylamino)uracil reductase RibD [Aquiluna borgnonia]
MNHTDYESAMKRALELALRGPAAGVNPQVGAVILNDSGEIVAEGWHLGSGTDHAEVMALKNLSAKFETLPKGLTAVVTLEPCNHTGKTGPCAQALIAAGISRVVYASSDPGDASSNGAQTLRDAGVEVISSVLETEADFQSRVWLTANRRRSPFVTLKWASSLDGRNAASDGSSKWISGEESRAHTHLQRSQCDAIAVGTATVLADDPELLARKSPNEYYSNQPLRVVIGNSDIPASARVLQGGDSVQLRTRDLQAALSELWARGVKHLLVEGGPNLASAFEEAGLVDEYQIYLAPVLLGGPRTSLTDIGVENISQGHRLEILETAQLGTDLFIRARRK